jgi:hypothetical protein
MDDLARPEGIEHRHIHAASGSIFRRWPFGLGGLAIVLVPAFFGVYGNDATLEADASEVRFTVEGPARIRNGEFFEITVAVEAKQNIEDLVMLVGSGLLRDVTVNTLLPDPSEHGFRDDSFEFRFGPLNAGERLQVKIDSQINPDHTPSVNGDTIAVADSEEVLATVDYAIEVLP